VLKKSRRSSYEDAFNKLQKGQCIPAPQCFDESSTTGAGTVEELETELEATRERAHEVEFQLQQSAQVGQFLLTRNEELEREVEELRREMEQITASDGVSQEGGAGRAESTKRSTADMTLHATLLTRNEELELENEQLRDDLLLAQQVKELTETPVTRRGGRKTTRRTTISCTGLEELRNSEAAREARSRLDSAMSQSPRGSRAARRSTAFGASFTEDFSKEMSSFKGEMDGRVRAVTEAKWQDRLQEVIEQNQALSDEC
jgi:hypothetical protein